MARTTDLVICRNCGKISKRVKWVKWCKDCASVKNVLSQRESQKRKRQELAEYKLSLGCSICGYNKSAAALDFHHVNPAQKERRISISFKTTLIQKELEKCVLVCKNCHAEEHEKERKVGEDDRQKST